MSTENLRNVRLSEIIDLPIHSVADTYPLLEMSVDEAKKQTWTLPALADNIRERGLDQPIVLFDDPDEGLLILDGRNRRLACELAAKTDKIPLDEFMVPVKYFVGNQDEADEFVFATNARRDTNASQKATSAALFLFDPRNEAAVKRLEDRAVTARLEGNARGAATTNSGERSAATLQQTETGLRQNEVVNILAKRYNVSARYIYDALKEKRQEIADREAAEREAALAEAKTKEAEEATKAAEEARAVGDEDKARESASTANRATNQAVEARERANEYSQSASQRASHFEAVHDGDKALRDNRDQLREISNTDPVVMFRTQINSACSNLKHAITELAKASGQGEDDYNFVGRKVTELIEHFEAEFGIMVED